MEPELPPASPWRNPPVDAKLAALEALRRWASTDRATLVAAAWRAGNRNVAELSAVAGKDRKTIYADLHSHGIDPARDREEPPMQTRTPTDDLVELPVPGWRHPHLISVRRRSIGYGGTQYMSEVKPFTGREPEPVLPEEWQRDHPTDGEHREFWSQRHTEIDLVRRVWAVAHFKVRVGALLAGGRETGYHRPAESWAQYQAARDRLREAYAALDTTPDNMWRSALLRIVDAKEPVELAASNWDYAAGQFAALDTWLLRILGESDHPTHGLRDAAAAHGVDITDWLIGSSYDYEEDSWSGGGPAHEEIREIIEKGDARIAAVQQMVDADRR
jgi:hypothetical protein